MPEGLGQPRPEKQCLYEREEWDDDQHTRRCNNLVVMRPFKWRDSGAPTRIEKKSQKTPRLTAFAGKHNAAHGRQRRILKVMSVEISDRNGRRRIFLHISWNPKM